MFFQEMCEATSMQEEREKGRKTMQKDCFWVLKAMLFQNKNTAFPASNHPAKILYL